MKHIAIALVVLAGQAQAGHELEGRDISGGKTLYTEHCAACHGGDLEGQPNWREVDENGMLPAPPHDETGHTWHHSNTQLFDYTKLGGQEALSRMGVTGFSSGMPGFGDTMSDAEIWDILAFIASTWPAREREIQEGRNPEH
jgi:mono/diheme cytochrome c family protein